MLTRPGRYKQVADNLHVKEVWVGDGERRKRYVLCLNPQEAERERQHRAQLLRELDAELSLLEQPRGGSPEGGLCAAGLAPLRPLSERGSARAAAAGCGEGEGGGEV